MQSIVIPVSKSALCGAYKSCMWHSLWSQSSNSGITGDIRLPSNSGVILHWCHCCDLSTESKTMDRSKSLVRFFKIEESYFWRVKASHMQKFPGLLLSVIKVVALFDLMFCRLKLHRLETLNWTFPWLSLILIKSIGMLQLEWGYTWLCLFSAILHYDCIFLSLPEMWQKLKTDFVPCCAQNIEQILILYILSYSHCWEVIKSVNSQCIMMKVMVWHFATSSPHQVMTALIVTLPSDYCCGDFSTIL